MTRYQLHQWAKIRPLPMGATLYIEGQAVTKMRNVEEGVFTVLHERQVWTVNDPSIVSTELVVDR